MKGYSHCIALKFQLQLLKLPVGAVHRHSGACPQSRRKAQHRASIILAISSGAAKITAARSPIMPAGMIAGAPFSGPSLLESVTKRRFALPKSACLIVGGSHALGV